MITLDNTVLTIFGITGDLARRKLLPALYQLFAAGLLPPFFKVIGISRRGTQTADIIKNVRDQVCREGSPCDETALQKLQDALSIQDMQIGEADEYHLLAERIAALENEAGSTVNRLYYLAIPAGLFETVISRLGQNDLNVFTPGGSESRFLIEKPFGTDLLSARELISRLDSCFDESQIFRIDHYLAKETAQNILTFRFMNPLFSKAWNAEHISHIIITAAETIGIEGRTAFYEKMGALRDLVQSHLLQLLALVTMDRPKSFSAEDIHHQKAKILQCIQPPSAADMRRQAIRGQYQKYREETGNPHSTTETYCALRLSIDNETWRGVPILVRTGKALRTKVTEITVVFRDAAVADRQNWLTIRIQPNEGIVIDLEIKKPGYSTETEKVQLDFCYNARINATHPDAYERVLVDAMRGDSTLFASSEEVLSCWRITEPILQAWAEPDFPLYSYTELSWGPQAAEAMIAEAGAEWLTEEHPVCTLKR